MTTITTIADLETLYGTPGPASLVKVADRITPDYSAWIRASGFCTLATVGPEGVDASPRGDRGQVAFELDDRTLALPDRRGNNRIDSLRNIVRDGRVALMFLIPGAGTVIRVNGRAEISVAPDMIDRFTVDGQPPRSVIVVHVAEVYFQCARAVMRAGLWDAAAWPDLTALPTPGRILSGLSGGAVGGPDYDAAWPARAAASLW